MWINCAAPHIIQAGRPVLCSGSTLASIHSALVYLDAMIATMLQYMSCTLQYKGFDQGAHQIVVCSGMLDGRTATYLIPNARGPPSA